MAQTTPPVLTIEPGESPFPRTATITEKVLAGKLDYITLNPAERWVGNVRTDGAWRWDSTNGTVTATDSLN